MCACAYTYTYSWLLVGWVCTLLTGVCPKLVIKFWHLLLLGSSTFIFWFLLPLRTGSRDSLQSVLFLISSPALLPPLLFVPRFFWAPLCLPLTRQKSYFFCRGPSSSRWRLVFFCAPCHEHRCPQLSLFKHRRITRKFQFSCNHLQVKAIYSGSFQFVVWIGSSVRGRGRDSNSPTSKPLSNG